LPRRSFGGEGFLPEQLAVFGIQREKVVGSAADDDNLFHPARSNHPFRGDGRGERIQLARLVVERCLPKKDQVFGVLAVDILFVPRPAGALRIADVGSGAGFPGFPVAVLRPECSVTLIESHQRKAVFLREASREIPNVRVLAKRAEDVAETFDWVISRAVSYADLAPVLKLLAANADLLSGAEGPPESLGFLWDTPLRLPWGDQRFLWTGRVVV